MICHNPIFQSPLHHLYASCILKVSFPSSLTVAFSSRHPDAIVPSLQHFQHDREGQGKGSEAGPRDLGWA